MPLRSGLAKSEVAHLDRTYSSPAKRYILLCNKAQTVCEIEVCEYDREPNQQTAGLAL